MPTLDKIPKQTLVNALLRLAEESDFARNMIERLTQDERERVAAIKKEITSIRRHKAFITYNSQRPFYQRLEALTTSIQEDIQSPETGVDLALLAYGLENKLPYILDGSDGGISEWFHSHRYTLSK